ncbi:MAG TPA: M1 family metallopeptidase [Chitinophagaceae bacterium]|nr:M1 family metallopeptidase [Chitinophagaceae bacterium]
MQKLLLACLVLAGLRAAPQAARGASRTGLLDVQHYAFRIELSDATDTIRGVATITLRVLAATDQVPLDLSPVNEKGRGMFVYRVTENQETVPYTREGDRLVVRPQGGCQAGQTRRFEIRYVGIPADGLIISRNKYGHRTFFADNWPNRGHNWLPCVDDPADKASVEFLITAPGHYQVVANGVQVEETNLADGRRLTHWQEEVPVATKVMVIGAADFAVNLSGTVDCIPVTSWVYPEDRDKGFYDYAQATGILRYYIDHIGPYGYRKLANVQSKTIFGGLENANTIFYSENSISGTRRNESLLAHEIAHQWFGNMATEKSFGHLWLSEGFATYCTILYLENKYGPDTARFMRAQDRREVIAFSQSSNHPVVDTAVTDYMQLLNPNSYQKGGWILHMLRHQLGDSVFWRSIRTYYAQYAGRNADTRDLQAVFEKVSGRNLQVFFDQWLYQPGVPVVSLGWKQVAGKLVVTVRQLQPRPFSFPLELAVRTATGDVRRERIEVRRAQESFTLPAPPGISEVQPDPDVHLLFDYRQP